MSRAVERGKILELEELAAVLEAARSDGKTVVQCHGVFDLLHVGHIRHLREAKRWGDLLVVTVTPDRYVNKGPDRPTFPEMLRAEVLAALDDVDYVTINRWPTAFESISLLRPTVYAKGPDYADAAKDLTGGISKEAEAVRSAGGVIRFTDDLAFSSSSLINRFLSPYPPEVNDYLASFRWRHSFDDLLGYLESLRSLRVLVVGEAILDEYVYCDVIGKSTKEPILALRHNSIEQYAGGALAIANHVADFCAGVELISYLGALNPREEFVRRNLKPGVEAQFVYKRGSPTIVKRRFVEQYLVTKLMELYEIDDSPLDDEAEMGLQAILGPALERADLVIVADFGHGMISRHTVDLLVRGARFLAVNTQLNAANLGYHAISKYPRASFVCMHEGEIRTDRRDRSTKLADLMVDLAARLGAETVIVTLGKRGLIAYRRDRGFTECPALSVKVVDRTGAGDAVFAVTSLLAARDVPHDVAGFIGSVVGAQAVTVVGNSASVDRIQLLKTVDALLK